MSVAHCSVNANGNHEKTKSSTSLAASLFKFVVLLVFLLGGLEQLFILFSVKTAALRSSIVGCGVMMIYSTTAVTK